MFALCCILVLKILHFSSVSIWNNLVWTRWDKTCSFWSQWSKANISPFWNLTDLIIGAYIIKDVVHCCCFLLPRREPVCLSFMDYSVVCKRKTFVDSAVQQLRDITAINSGMLLKLKKEGIGDNWLLPMLIKGCQLFRPNLYTVALMVLVIAGDNMLRIVCTPISLIKQTTQNGL